MFAAFSTSCFPFLDCELGVEKKKSRLSGTRRLQSCELLGAGWCVLTALTSRWNLWELRRISISPEEVLGVLDREIFLILKYQAVVSTPVLDGLESCPVIFCFIRFVNWKHRNGLFFFSLKEWALVPIIAAGWLCKF